MVVKDMIDDECNNVAEEASELEYEVDEDERSKEEVDIMEEREGKNNEVETETNDICEDDSNVVVALDDTGAVLEGCENEVGGTGAGHIQELLLLRFVSICTHTHTHTNKKKLWLIIRIRYDGID